MPIPSVKASLSIIVLKGKHIQLQQFLQGIATSNMQDIKQHAGQWSAFCDPKGRVIATAWIQSIDDAWLLCLQDKEVADRLLGHLKPYAALSRCLMDNTSLTGVIVDAKAKNDIAQTTMHFAMVCEDLYYCIGVQETIDSIDIQRRLSVDDAMLACITKGLMPIGPGFCGNYTPQMLDLVDTMVSFDKGCFIGQEVIARTHHLGKRKRFVVRLRSDNLDVNIESGMAIMANDRIQGHVLYHLKDLKMPVIYAVLPLSSMQLSLYLSDKHTTAVSLMDEHD